MNLVRACSDDFRQLRIGALRAAGALVVGLKSTWLVDGKSYVVSVSGDSVGDKNSSFDVLNIKHIEIDNQPVGVTFTTNMGRGGVRCWFVCPTCKCRTHKLYDRERLQCRRCAKLYFLTELSSGRSAYGPRTWEHAKRRLRKLRVKLKWPLEDEFFLPGPKPKWMHWPTFARLSVKHAQARAQWVVALDKLGRKKNISAKKKISGQKKK